MDHTYHYPPMPGATRSLAYPTLFVDGDSVAMLEEDVKLSCRMASQGEMLLTDALAEMATRRGEARKLARDYVLDCVSYVRTARATYWNAWARMAAFHGAA